MTNVKENRSQLFQNAMPDAFAFKVSKVIRILYSTLKKYFYYPLNSKTETITHVLLFIQK